MRLILLIFVVAFLSSCMSEQQGGSGLANPYFALDSFVKQEIAFYKDKRPVLKKIIILNGKKDTISVDSVDYGKLLEPLEDCNIHKPNLIGSYSIDSSYVKDTLHINYTANNDKLILRNLNVSFLDGKVSKVVAIKNSDGLFSYAYQKLVYIPQKKLDIRKEYKTLFTSKDDIEIISTFQ